MKIIYEVFIDYKKEEIKQWKKEAFTLSFHQEKNSILPATPKGSACTPLRPIICSLKLKIL
jgi:hypothetical protein